MGFFDDALKGAVPGGNVAKPLAIAIGALVLSNMFNKSSASAPASPQTEPPSGGGLVGGLGGLLEKFTQSGHGDVASSWVGSGPNKPIEPGQLSNALGQQTISDLAAKAGVSQQELLDMLSKALPGVVDKMTPNGRVPTVAEIDNHGR